jgi:3-hydroxyisobutyrate dehydrogenase
MKLGFIGVGNMGNPMCANLVSAGHDVTVTDLARSAAENLIEAGATWAATAKEAAEGAEIVFMSLPAPPDVEKVTTAADGVLAGMQGGTLIDLSTNSPTMVQSLAAKAQAQGVQFLDAPVSGGVVGARKGTLAVMVGGDEAVYEAAKPVLDAIGTNVFHVGDVGAGNVAKLVNNMLAFIGMMGAIEALALGAKAGVDPYKLWQIVKASSGNSFIWEGGARAILRDRLRPSFTTTLASKDIGLATALGEELGVDLPMGHAAQDLIVGFRDNGFAEEDVLATVKAVEEAVGTQVRGFWPEDA